MALGRGAAVIGCLLAVTACENSGLVKRYEYDERIQLSLDGAAVVDINASIPALVALRGAPLDVDPEARFDRRVFKKLYEGPGVTVRDVSAYRRRGRRFVHVRLDVDSITTLSRLAPLSWSRYKLVQQGNEFNFMQEVGPAAGLPIGDAGWTGNELIAFRVHMPSRIVFHNALELERGNTLAWEQRLRDRLAGAPLRMEARIETQLILYRSLWLFGGTFVSAITMLALIVWWVGRKGRSVMPA